MFTVQTQVIPVLLDNSALGHVVGRAGYRPSDICCSAPTGSGKTLAFVLPIVQVLRRRVVCRVRALVVLPVRDLATQVYKVFQTYCKCTKLKVNIMYQRNYKTCNVLVHRQPSYMYMALRVRFRLDWLLDRKLSKLSNRLLLENTNEIGDQ